MPRFPSLLSLLALLTVGCSSPGVHPDVDAGYDAGRPDAGHDAGQDSGTFDAGYDAGTTDAGFDAGSRYTVSAGGSVTDSTTGLVWQAMDWGTSYTQPDASTYCFTLTLDGSSSWRLPTKDEVVAVAGTFPGALAGSTFWTSTAAPTANSHWYANFATGATSYSGDANTFHARCVR